MARIRVETDYHRTFWVESEEDLRESMWLDKEPRLAIPVDLAAEIDELHTKYFAMQAKLEALYRSQQGLVADASLPAPEHEVLK